MPSGPKWLNICIDCGHQVLTYGLNLVGQCPECAKTSRSKGWRWACRMEIPVKSLKQNSSVKNSTQKSPASVSTPTGFMSPLNGTDKPPIKGKMRVVQTCPGGKGRPKLDIPLGAIKKLHEKGYGAKRIARQLSEEYSTPVSYQTILRRLGNNGN